MGIDAQMLIRGVAAAIVTDEWLIQKSFDLCTSLGAENFTVSDGLPPGAYSAASVKWAEAFKQHPKSKHYGLRAEVLADIGPAPIARHTALFRTEVYGRGLTAPGTVYQQDGPDILAAPGECLLEVGLLTRFYGVGYERGDLLLLCAVAEWCEANIPNCTIWYGGDSSGCTARLFDKPARKVLRSHLYGPEGRAYFCSWGTEPHGRPPACGICPKGAFEGARNGGGPVFSSFSCRGCGRQRATHDSGNTWRDEKKGF